MAKVGSNDVDVTLFNDGNENFPNFRREHFVHLEMTGIDCAEIHQGILINSRVR